MGQLRSCEQSWVMLLPSDDRARDKMDAAFEFFTKIGADYYCFHDVAVEGSLAIMW